MASIKDIAKACGVSVATVSKALNGHNDISQATKEKVREAARQIGYMPNSAARALKTNRTYNLGVLFVDEAQSGLTHEFFAAVLDSFKRHAEGRGYDITFINHNIGHGHSSYLEHCRYRGVDGVIAACIKFDDPEVGKRLAFTGAVKDDVLDIEELACYLMDYLAAHYADTLTERYKIEVEPGDTGYELLEKAGRKRGFLMRGAQVDTERMARILLDEFRAGKLGRFTLETAPTEEVTP